MPVFPSAEFIASYDAGRGQRYYLFGTNNPFAQIVEYYKTVLKQRGELVYDEPPGPHVRGRPVPRGDDGVPAGGHGEGLRVGRTLGYLNPKRGAEPARFKTIIQIVPAPGGTPK